jgi:hypothetical protein
LKISNEILSPVSGASNGHGNRASLWIHTLHSADLQRQSSKVLSPATVFNFSLAPALQRKPHTF